jgi:hypothetical protein
MAVALGGGVNENVPDCGRVGNCRRKFRKGTKAKVNFSAANRVHAEPVRRATALTP